MRYTITLDLDIPVESKAALDNIAVRYFERTYGTPWPHEDPQVNTFLSALIDTLQLNEDAPGSDMVIQVRSGLAASHTDAGVFQGFDRFQPPAWAGIRSDALTVQGHIALAREEGALGPQA